MTHIQLGASLYVPATRADLVSIGNGRRYPILRSVIFCTEDSIRPAEVAVALGNLREALPQFQAAPLQRFIRPRTPELLERLLAMEGIENVCGFVVPKASTSVLKQYQDLLAGHESFLLMPTLETADVFDHHAMIDLREWLSEPQVRARILALRIGGNDLLHLLGVRRRPDRTIYETGLGPVIAMLAATFLPHGLALTAPVFEGLAHPSVLQVEVQRDLDHGLIGKTAIHPVQVPQIEAAYAVDQEELEMALALLQPDAPAVFRMHNVMCEEATHWRWARTILARSQIFGVRRESVADFVPNGQPHATLRAAGSSC